MKNIHKSELMMIINNDEKLYSGTDLWYYAKKLFFAKNAKLGYHNFRHMMHVTYQVYDAIKVTKINATGARILLLAAMFHDYGHSGDGTQSDSINIARSVERVKIHIDPNDEKYLTEIIRLIRATEWHGEAGHSIFEQDMFIDILRDADSSQTFDTSWIQQVIFGLGTELGKSPREMLESQLPFLENKVKFYSAWGKEKFEPILKQRIEEVKIWQEKILHH
jgi:hypothetical protein